jgi:hypothetical protein
MEAVLDFGRGCQDLAIKILMGVWGRGGGGNEARASCLCHHIWMGEGEIGDGLVTVCTPHICNPLSHSSFSYLRSAVEASFDIKRLVWSRTERTVHKVPGEYVLSLVIKREYCT